MAKKVYDRFEELKLRAKLEKKRMTVLAMIPEIQPTGLEADKKGELIPFTNAEDVRQRYFAVFREVGLSVAPVAAPGMMPQVSYENGMFSVAGAYEITDTETGYSVIGWGAGCGENGHWAGNTAQTKAMKQFLLASFMCNWKDPTRPSHIELVEQYGEQAEVILSMMKSPTPISDEILEFFGDQLKPKKGKAKKNGKRTKTKRRKAAGKGPDKRKKAGRRKIKKVNKGRRKGKK